MICTFYQILFTIGLTIQLLLTETRRMSGVIWQAPTSAKVHTKI